MTANPQLASTALTLDVGTAGELGRGFIQRLTLQHYFIITDIEDVAQVDMEILSNTAVDAWNSDVLECDLEVEAFLKAWRSVAPTKRQMVSRCVRPVWRKIGIDRKPMPVRFSHFWDLT